MHRIVGGGLGINQMRLGSPGPFVKCLMVSASRQMMISGVSSREGGGIVKSSPGVLVSVLNKCFSWSRVIHKVHIQFLGPGSSG